MSKKLTEKEVLERFPELGELGKQKKAEASFTEAQNMRRELCDFARDHNLVIHPGNGYNYYIESFLMFNCCPCDKTGTRTHCPCPEAIEEVPRVGHCLCRLFWRSLDFYKETILGAK